MNWKTILGREVCSLFKYGVLNAHAGDLPRYKGNACPNWAILNNEKHIGLTIHKMEPDQIDSGDIYEKEFYVLDSDTYISKIYEWMSSRVPNMFLSVVEKIDANNISPIKQSSLKMNSLRCYPRKPEDSIIEWDNDRDNIYALIELLPNHFLELTLS